MKALFLGKGLNEASTRYRAVPVMNALRKNQHDVTFQSSELSFYEKLVLLVSAANFDVVFIQRKLFSKWFTKLLRYRAKHLVFDFDDAVFSKSSGHQSSSRKAKFEALCQASDLVLAGNAYLADAAQSAGAASVSLVPTCIDVSRYRHSARQHDQITLVWIGSSSTRRYLDMLTPVLEWLGNARADVQLKVIADFEFRLEAMPVMNVNWSESEEVEALGACHIGLAPMIDDPWTRGKCALKVLQYMAAGLPVVSARCGANKDVIDEGASGFTAETDEDWYKAIVTLADDAALRKTFGERGREMVAQRFDLQPVASRVCDEVIALAGSE